MGIFLFNAHRYDTSRSALGRTSVEKLFRESESEAEYTTGWVRITLGLAMFVSGILVTSGTTELTDMNNSNQLRASALFTVFAFLALGIISLLLVVSGRFRPWMAFVLVTCDAAILGVSLYFALHGIGLGVIGWQPSRRSGPYPSFLLSARFDIGRSFKYGPPLQQ
ncbi:hypothetical protein U8C40_39790 (plasmid) [Sinorhizobium medicae]|uniref:hypothetical protein n=1 Tax=Sinorhizobium medicae TaxID=110321 RepID=UPI002B1BE281|nr:hypothetical protein [Sinorhizobium medicae]WQO48582.1 hypothetical protein U8C42_27545 [Sinorhizobium medicae]WQO70682.1 hypothetical protein U8C40_39790 [Sinorhizobium medicae]